MPRSDGSCPPSSAQPADCRSISVPSTVVVMSGSWSRRFAGACVGLLATHEIPHRLRALVNRCRADRREPEGCMERIGRGVGGPDIDLAGNVRVAKHLRPPEEV